MMAPIPLKAPSPKLVTVLEAAKAKARWKRASCFFHNRVSQTFASRSHGVELLVGKFTLQAGLIWLPKALSA